MALPEVKKMQFLRVTAFAVIVIGAFGLGCGALFVAIRVMDWMFENLLGMLGA